ncbi:LPS assembly lipoprotein LptE [Aquicoccus sp. G2-2]|uniref:LPS assembly lipoprotein LptE n=1 Tax=Aquicoccus sp. G2-2 TaxID=3092120 RepID=UPI002ADF748B|nr:LPS assembly lipoprotein LptE [Aquicoccus sp. G2-2]MEA1114524.1 LPS assembly lipoprotein LptE [Aquicoccus sp. G2-2]
MWWSDRRGFLSLAAAATLALAGCGFTPVYAPGAAATQLQNAVLVDEPVDRESYVLVRQLEQRLGRAEAPRYGLSLALDLKQERMAITASNITTRFNLIGQVAYALRDLDGGKVLISGNAQSFTGYSATGSTAATQAARRDAAERLMTILADQISTRLMAGAGALVP